MKKLLYQVADALAWSAGLGRSAARESVAILMLHGVHDGPMQARRPAPHNSMPLEGFVAGIEAVLQRYQILSLDDAVAMLAGQIPWQPRSVVLTFDDSLRCLLPTAARWLAERRLPATFYLSTDVIEAQRAYWWKRLEFAFARARQSRARIELPGGSVFSLEPASGTASLTEFKLALKKLPGPQVESAVLQVEEQLQAALDLGQEPDPYAEILSWAEVRRLVELGMTVGSHSLSHPNLTLLSPAELARELGESRSLLESRTGAPCRHFCYPYGAYSDSVCQAAARAGYASAVTTDAPGHNRLGADPFRLRRFAMPFAGHKVRPLLLGVG